MWELKSKARLKATVISTQFGETTMLSIVLFLIIITLLFLGNDKRHAGTVVPTRLPYSHHDVVVRESKRLTAYADFILDGGELYE